jgi:hypothetical protein
VKDVQDVGMCSVLTGQASSLPSYLLDMPRPSQDADVVRFLKLFTELPLAEIDELAKLEVPPLTTLVQIGRTSLPLPVRIGRTSLPTPHGSDAHLLPWQPGDAYRR